jgi:anti-sigma B factor antagonist
MSGSPYAIAEQDGYSVVMLTGDVDLSHSPQARKVILECLSKQQPLMVDLSQVDYIDSSGVASLVEGYQLSRKKDVDFGLVGVSEAAMNVLRLARLDQVFPIYASIEDRLRRGE